MGYSMEAFDVVEKRATSVFENDKNVTVLNATVNRLDVDNHVSLIVSFRIISIYGGFLP